MEQGPRRRGQAVGRPVSWQPERAVEIVAGTPPGGGLDRAARALAAAIEASGLLAVPAQVVNVGGDGGRKGWTYVDRFPGDAHVIAISSPNLAADFLTGVTRTDPDGYTPLAILYTEYIAFVVPAGSHLRSGADLLACFATDAAAVTVALSTSLGNSNHVAVANVIRHAGADTRAPKIRVFDTALDVVTDVIAGNADVGAITAASPVPELKAGRLRAIAISSPARLPGLYTSVPTWLEQSVDCDIGSWRGVNGPAGLNAAQIAFWEAVLAAATRTPKWKSELERYFWTEVHIDGAALRDHLSRERADMRAALHGLGLLAS
jgi:putative tricarboxylic transport membrane protein